MAELERDLRELGGALAWPATPDLTLAVRERIAAAPARRAVPLRRSLVLCFAVLLVAAGAVLAVPSARTAVLEWLGLRGVTIERVETAPTATLDLEDVDVLLGRSVTLAEARRQADYPVAVPEALGSPDGVYLDTGAPGGGVSLVYLDDEGRIESVLTQFRAGISEEFIHKSVGPETTLQPVSVAGGRGWWLEGEPHEVIYATEAGEPLFTRTRLATNTLLWERGDVTLRLEGPFTRSSALAIAESAG